jgi:hypothetical protein
MTKKRVIAFGSGYLGKHGIRKIIEHPDLELVGLRVWSADKVGSDAGTIAETDAVGLAATDDVEALLALKADCVAYFASTVGRDEDALADVLPFLKAGTNVVSISLRCAISGFWRSGSGHPVAGRLHGRRQQLPAHRRGAWLRVRAIPVHPPLHLRSRRFGRGARDVHGPELCGP